MFSLTNLIYSSRDLDTATTPEEAKAKYQSHYVRSLLTYTTDTIILITTIVLFVLSSPITGSLLPVGLYAPFYFIALGEICVFFLSCIGSVFFASAQENNI